MSIDWWQTRDLKSGDYRDVTDMDIARVRERATETANVSTRLQMAHAPTLDRQRVFVAAFKSALAVEIAMLKA